MRINILLFFANHDNTILMKKNLFKDIIIFSSTLQISIINLGIEKTNSIDDEGNKPKSIKFIKNIVILGDIEIIITQIRKELDDNI